jgi:hypothetical protein
MRKIITVAILAGWLASLPVSPGIAAEGWKAEIRPLVERLHVNYRSLDAVYHRLHEAAIETVDRSAEELSYIQKTYLFVSEANLICFYQWELLAAVDYIQEKKMADYLTLRIKDLNRSIFESRDRIHSLKLYSGFIEHSGALESIDQAIGLIEGNIYTYEALRDALQPRANPPNRYNQKL